ncbi:contractile injection system tape measure protein, partial [Parabacteroides goldsteinii]|uniref:contractile injection system tape measure protein n=1 Tax=Parabacteroides goldsteinii TaxID=328812 RepID=UPI00258F6EA0
MKNAGIVLTTPFLPMFFYRLGYLADSRREFIDKEKQIRCRISLAGGTSVLEEASLYLLPEKIRSISADSYT